MNATLKRLLKYGIALVLVIVSVWLAVKDIDFGKFWADIKKADYFYVALSIPVIILSHWLRAWRWRTMLEPIQKVKSIWNLFSAVMIGYAVNVVTSRGGEFVRPYVYARREKISFSSTFATIVVERFIDIISLILIFFAVFFFFGDRIVQMLPSMEFDKLIVPALIVLGVLLFSFYPPVFKFVLRIVIKPFSNSLFEKISGIFDRFLAGFTIIRKPSQYLKLGIESLLIWVCYTLPLYLMFYSFSFANSAGLGFTDAILLVVISGIGVTIAPTPAAIGVYHYLIQNTLFVIYGVQQETGLAYATIVHTVNTLVQLIVGGIFFLSENVKGIPLKGDMSADIDNGSKEKAITQKNE